MPKNSPLTAEWRWGVKFLDGTYEYLDGNTIEEAVGSIGSLMAEVRRYLPVVSRATQEAKHASLKAFLSKRKDGKQND